MKNKSEKTQAECERQILKIIGRYETIEIGPLLQEMSVFTGEEVSETFRRKIHRYLESLVKANELSRESYSQDGVLLDDKDENIKNKKCKWSIPKATSGIQGHKLLLDSKANIFFDTSLKTDIELGRGRTVRSSKGRTLYFNLGHEFLHLRIEDDALPYMIHFSRNPDFVNVNELKELQKIFGRRLILLRIPCAHMSSYKNDEKQGHAILKFNGNGTIEIKDLESSNGTTYTEISSSAAEELIQSGSVMGNQTVMKPWAEEKTLVGNVRREIDKGKSVITKGPVLVEVPEQFKVLVV